MNEAAGVVARFAERGWTLGTCESLTGGLVAAALTDVPGASAVFRGGLVTYASDLKASLAHVDAEFIGKHGVINAETACQMAQGARVAMGVDWAVACTGVAGPAPQDGAEPGTVFIAVAGSDRVEARQLALVGQRRQIRQACVAHCLQLVLELSC